MTTIAAVQSEPENLGAVAVDGNIKYELSEYDARHVKLQNILQPEQYIIIDREALQGIASILNKAEKSLGR